jgi:oligopeptide/dipeptide ABC transporter ATP-binding protein
MSDLALDLTDLVVRGTRPIVEGVCLAIDAGEVLAIVGESGSGKTITSRAILGLLPQTLSATGEVTTAGVRKSAADQSGLRRDLGRTTAVVFQNPRLMFDPLMRVGDQLIEARTGSRGEAKQRAVEVLQTLGFDAPRVVLRQFPHQLSGGMAQRAALAMAVMPGPRLLVVDEPTSALDATLRLQAMQSIRTLARSGTAVLFITHDMKLVNDYCDTLVVMYGGRAMERGPTKSVLASPLHPYTERLLACSRGASDRHQDLPSIPGTQIVAGTAGDACPFAGRCAETYSRCRTARPAHRRVGDREVACHLRDSEAVYEER